MYTWHYFTRPINLAYHNLTQDNTTLLHLRSTLGLGLKFCPTPTYSTHRYTIKKHFRDSVVTYTSRVIYRGWNSTKKGFTILKCT